MGAHSAEHKKIIPGYGRLLLASIAGPAALTGITGVVSGPVAEAASLLDNIAQCESSGNPHASNGTHFGLFQFDISTWRSVGGQGNPGNASVAEQYARAQALFKARGTQPWDASESCWENLPVDGVSAQVKVDLPPVKVEVKVEPSPTPIHDQLVEEMKPQPQPQPQAQRHKVVRGDTLSEIAFRNGIRGGWRTLFNLNRHIISNPNLIYPGQVIKLA